MNIIEGNDIIHFIASQHLNNCFVSKLLTAYCQ